MLASTWRWFAGGGPLMWVLLCMGLLLLTCMFERCIMLYGLLPQQHGRKHVAAAATQRLGLLRILTTLLPLIGLLGTVSGLILSFSAMTDVSMSNLLSVGVSQALKTTQLGLALASIGLLTERLCSRQAHLLTQRCTTHGAQS